MAKNKNKKKKNKALVLAENATSVDIRRAILYAYFNDIKPEDMGESHALELLTNIAQYNLSKNNE
jgi:hypothetical protein